MHEKAKARLVSIPTSAAAAWADGFPWPSNLHMMLASNASHLAQESVRHLVADNAAFTFTLGAKDNTWADISDVTPPSAGDIAAASPVYKKVSWGPEWTLRYGPFHAICDRKSGEGLYVMRKIKGRVSYGTVGPDDTLIVVVLTTHSSPQGINEGDVLDYDSTSVTGTVTGDLDFEFSPLMQDRPVYPVFCREPSSRATSYVAITPLYLWVCVESKDGATINAVSAWETR